MKQFLLALGTALIIVPAAATPRHGSDPSTRKFFFQNTPITGKVTDDKGEPIAGVTVQIKGLKTSTTTNADGSFTIDAPAGAATLVFSHVGMQRREVSIGGKSEFQIQLSSADSTLSDVVVVGYGTQKIKDVTGSVVPVDMKKMEDMPTRTITEALSVQVHGLNVSGGNYRP